MWRADSLFGQSELPNHQTGIIADTHATLPQRIQMIGQHVAHTVWGAPVVLCRICHAELQAHEQTAGCCDDADSCTWRALSERCCW